MTKRFGLLSHLLRQAKGTEDLLYPDPHGKKTHALQMKIMERGKVTVDALCRRHQEERCRRSVKCQANHELVSFVQCVSI